MGFYFALICNGILLQSNVFFIVFWRIVGLLKSYWRHVPRMHNAGKNHFYWDNPSGVNFSSDKLISRHFEINCNEYFSYDVFSGVCYYGGNVDKHTSRHRSDSDNIGFSR